MHVFTSITANYLPKAASLAHSVKRVHPEATFHLVLSDDMPDCPSRITEAFDSIINIRDLPIPNLSRFIFRHRIVELCTAVKGAAFQHIADVHGAERIYYFDPDIIVSNRLDDLERALDADSVLLTPHSIEPETEPTAMVDNEHTCLRHGIYNLGFLAVRMDRNGRRFIDWWADRLSRWCYDEVPSGLFTDQRWIDLAPAIFDGIKILRDPQYNVSTWNLSHRRATGRSPYDIAINGRPLVFYHFSGFDSGAQLMMLDRYGSHSPVLYDFREWYIDQCERHGQSTVGKIPCRYTRYASGAKVEDAHRLTYRQRDDLMTYFPDPFDDSAPENSYRHWYRTYSETPPALPVVDAAAESAPEPSSEPAGATNLRRVIRAHAPEPAVKAYRSVRAAIKRLAKAD
ncbi:glycosyl transferase [Paludisphaera mucosa]|uniref:Glycosyl transferase n=1 Tax=Paludisphaera mucosa TaxID=3030827 RepID=A0ABT6F657_9BACT|nr:glycosyl transferase [Paludisphaera mucosa]MDG3003072.1 glycosyl transferase [Paludisphaera mucosa]